MQVSPPLEEDSKLDDTIIECPYHKSALKSHREPTNNKLQLLQNEFNNNYKSDNDETDGQEIFRQVQILSFDQNQSEGSQGLEDDFDDHNAVNMRDYNSMSPMVSKIYN